MKPRIMDSFLCHYYRDVWSPSRSSFPVAVFSILQIQQRSSAGTCWHHSESLTWCWERLRSVQHHRWPYPLILPHIVCWTANF